ncbi:SDR family NAD(P)-dependent oxidoreductase [Endozoicomonas atrinae]|uniref:SDR family NAD(P)-dependent oxidoreductase n=1 Tax=Endozoicomonas atrinae TaxID=1333660 RepID=UPI003B0037A2
MSSLKGKTVVITGASRGIGQAIALRCAMDGANIVVAAKTVEPHPKELSTPLRKRSRRKEEKLCRFR